jgi:hypothetical protein
MTKADVERDQRGRAARRRELRKMGAGAPRGHRAGAGPSRGGAIVGGVKRGRGGAIVGGVKRAGSR